MATTVEEAEVSAQQDRRAHAAAVGYLQTYRLNGAHPFCSNPADMAHQIVQSINAFSIVMQTVLYDADAAKRANQDAGQGILELYPVHLAQTFEAVDKLAALACFFLEAPQA